MVIPATAFVVSMGIYANYLGYSTVLTGHKVRFPFPATLAQPAVDSV